MGIDTRKVDFIKKVSEMNEETFVQIENLVAAFLNSDKSVWYDDLSNMDITTYYSTINFFPNTTSAVLICTK